MIKTAIFIQNAYGYISITNKYKPLDIKLSHSITK